MNFSNTNIIFQINNLINLFFYYIIYKKKCAPGLVRTVDLQVNSLTLYRLSYQGYKYYNYTKLFKSIIKSIYIFLILFNSKAYIYFLFNLISFKQILSLIINDLYINFDNIIFVFTCFFPKKTNLFFAIIIFYFLI